MLVPRIDHAKDAYLHITHSTHDMLHQRLYLI